jgi:hypothetical protein
MPPVVCISIYILLSNTINNLQWLLAWPFIHVLYRCPQMFGVLKWYIFTTVIHKWKRPNKQWWQTQLLNSACAPLVIEQVIWMTLCLSPNSVTLSGYHLHGCPWKHSKLGLPTRQCNFVHIALNEKFPYQWFRRGGPNVTAPIQHYSTFLSVVTCIEAYSSVRYAVLKH